MLPYVFSVKYLIASIPDIAVIDLNLTLFNSGPRAFPAKYLATLSLSSDEFENESIICFGEYPAKVRAYGVIAVATFLTSTSNSAIAASLCCVRVRVVFVCG